MYCRFFFAFAWFLFATLTVENNVLLLFTLVTTVLLYMQTKSFIIISRSFRLLIWLLVPIILLHTIFTPGTYLMGFPVSVEGIKQSFSLSVNLTCMFFTALLVMNTIQMKQCLFWLQGKPKLNRAITPSLMLLMRLRTMIPQELGMQRVRWQSLEHKWLSLPDMLFESISSILKRSRDEAKSLWEKWDEEVEQLFMMDHAISKLDISDIGFAALGVLALFGLWLL